MACLEMYNSEHKGHHHLHCPPISPRISFSNDFVDSQHASIIHQERSSRDAPVSSDFEFSVSSYSMMSADELFSKGRILPFKDTQMQRTTTTLREELLVDDDDEYEHFSLRPPKGPSTSWKGFLGLRKSHIGSKKADKSEGSIDKEVDGPRRSRLVNEGARVTVTSQEGGSGCRDVEIGI
ncbi:uncharacterized protein LOC114737335 [Neltuma alba]|uniref:uncharacterized protein LOC114719198 n=1 Tax=Neltuma alba TaxID=207710 RepID=UPI0010A4561F|nr:uncharacterized protein LOC114719198 [Prosopis alba]XP_028781084.1 uncharacterized protein LOC114737335 [Prosopis alba]